MKSPNVSYLIVIFKIISHKTEDIAGPCKISMASLMRQWFLWYMQFSRFSII